MSWDNVAADLAGDAGGHQETADAFHELWYEGHRAPWSTRWKGRQLVKNPLDLWICTEIIYETRPDVIIECGTFRGGSAHFFADMMQAINRRGRVISVDIQPVEQPPHPHVTYVRGDSSSVPLPKVSGRVMVILDSDHSKEHVLKELDRFAPLVTPGCYLIVEDSNVGGNPIEPDYGTGGPHAAVMEWIPQNPNFVIDKSKERYILTMNPDGWLLKT